MMFKSFNCRVLQLISLLYKDKSTTIFGFCKSGRRQMDQPAGPQLASSMTLGGLAKGIGKCSILK